MNVLFVHDHKFRKVGDDLYSTGGLTNEVFSRYTKHVDNLTVVARIVEEANADGRWSKITDEKVSIVGRNTISNSEFKKLILDCDKMIVRMPSFIGLQALKLNLKTKKSYMIEMVGCAWDSLWNHGLAGRVIAPFAFFLNKYWAQKAECVLYVTNEFLQRRYPTKGKNIGCSDVVIPKCDDYVLDRRLKKIDDNDGKIIIGTTAAVDVRYKGQQFVIRALGELKKQGITNFEYQLVGNGDQSYLKSIAKENDVEDQVRFWGGVPHEKIFDWLDSIDIYVQPSQQEGLPRALVEAMSRGLPSFGARTGGIPELLSPSYIFDNSKHRVTEICSILCSFNEITMTEQAKRNFDKAKAFQKEALEEHRDEFYLSFFQN